MNEDPARAPSQAGHVALSTVAREWGRLGCIGFGGPPTHIALLRRLCVEERGWLTARDFEDGIAATNLLPGTGVDPAGHLLRLATARPPGRGGGRPLLHPPGPRRDPGPLRAVPRLDPPAWVLGAAAGAGAAVPGGGGRARRSPCSPRAGAQSSTRRAALRWTLYLLAARLAAATVGPLLVLVLVGCRAGRDRRPSEPPPSDRPGDVSAVVPVAAAHADRGHRWDRRAGLGRPQGGGARPTGVGS